MSRSLLGLVATGVGAACAYGAFTAGLFSQPLWTGEGLRRFLLFAAGFAAWSGLWITLRPALYFMATGIVAAAWIAYTGGAVPLAIVVLFVLACRSIGRGIDSDPLLSIALGAAVLMMAIQVLVWFPINRWPLYLVMLAAPVAWDFRALAGLPGAVPKPDRRTAATAAPLLFVCLCHLLVALKPEVGADALAMHLTVPAWIGAHGYWAFDPDRFVWSVMPMGANWLFTAVYLPGGEQAARLLSFGALLFVLAAIRSLSGSVGAAALLASIPLVQLITGSLFVENVQAAMCIGAIAAIARARTMPAALLLGAAMLVKVNSLTVVAPALLLLRNARLAHAAVFLLLATPPYLIAWLRTGNPVYPLANAIFRAAGFSTTTPLADPRFSEPVSLTTLWDLTFHTRRYFEGWDGAFGLQWLLLPLAILCWPRVTRPVRLSAAMGVAALLANLLLTPNLRYLTTPLALIAPLAAPLLTASRVAATVLAVCFVANLLLLPASSSWHRGFAFEDPAAYVLESAPVRPLIEQLNREHPGEAVLFLETAQIAGLTGRAYTNSWYHWSFDQRLQKADTTGQLLTILKQAGIGLLVTPNSSKIPQTGLAEIVSRYTSVVRESGPYQLRVLRHDPIGPRLQHTLGPGRYEDTEPAIEYSASWRRQSGFESAAGGAVTYTGVTGGSAKLRFAGAGVRWIFTRAPNRGHARISLDGGPFAELDQRSPVVAWQASHDITGLAPGEHTLRIEAAGDGFADIDAIEVLPVPGKSAVVGTAQQ